MENQIIIKDVTVADLYRMSKSIMMKCPSLVYAIMYEGKYTYEDIIQELVTKMHSESYRYDEDKGKVTTFFMSVAHTYLLMIIRHLRTAKRYCVTLSLDNEILSDSDDGVIGYIDTVRDERRSSLHFMEIEAAFKIIQPLICEELRLSLAGHNQLEISQMKNISQAQVSRKISRNKDEMTKALLEQGIVIGELLNAI